LLLGFSVFHSSLRLEFSVLQLEEKETPKTEYMIYAACSTLDLIPIPIPRPILILILILIPIPTRVPVLVV